MSDLSAVPAFVPAGPAVPDRRTVRPYQSGPQAVPGNPALAQLAADAAALRRIEADRPRLVTQALLTGTTPKQVVGVLGWELDELRFAIGRWVPKLRKQRQLTEEQGAALQTTVHESR